MGSTSSVYTSPDPATTEQAPPPANEAAPEMPNPALLKKLTPGSNEYIAEVFRYHPPMPQQIPQYEAIREAARVFAGVIVAHCPPSADRSDALRKLRETVMTANASIALQGRA